MFFESWSEIARIVISVLIIYPALILSTHVVGKRSFAQMNNFDWIITVAMGSILGSSILLKDVVIVEVLVAVSLLLALQYCLTYISAHSQKFDDTIKTDPQLVFYNGQFITSAMKDARLSRTEIEAALRKAGYGDSNNVQAVVFEGDGELSIVAKSEVAGDLLNRVIKQGTS